MNPVVLRPAAAEDLPILQRIEVEAAALFPATTLPPHVAAPLPIEVLQSCLSASNLWVAEEVDFGPVGFLATETHGTSLHLREMDVLPCKGQKGVGTLLLRRLLQVAKQRGKLFVTLTTFAHLPWNAPFYARNGFLEVTDFTVLPHLAAALRDERAQGLESRIAMARNVV